MKIQELQLEQIIVSWLYDPLKVFTTNLKLVNLKDLDFVRVSMDKFENQRNNFEEGSFFPYSLLETSCIPLWW